MSKKIIATALLPFAALAQDPSVIPSEETTIVTANRVEQAVSSVLAPVTVITREDIELSQVKSVPEIFRMLPGVDVATNGGRGQLASVFVRGGESSYTLVLIDGIRMTNSMTGSVDFNQIPINQVERIEFIRGAKAAIYGSEAISGVINIITKTGYSNDETAITAGAGSKNYREGKLYSSYNITDDTHLKLTANYETTDGYNVRPYPGINDGDTHGFDSQNYSIQLGHDFSEKWSSFVQSRYYQNTTEYAAGSYSGAIRPGEKKDHWVENKSADFGLKYASNELQSSVHYRISKQDDFDYFSSDGRGSDGDGANVYDQQDASWITSYVVNQDLLVTGGVDWRLEAMDVYGGFPDDSRYNRAVFGNVSSTHSDVIIEAAARLDDNEFYGSKTTWNIGAGWQLNKEYRLTVNTGTAFKAPSLYQLNSTSGNPDLKPEEAKSVEVGLSASVDKVDFDLQIYRNEITDKIEYVGIWPNSRPENVDGKSVLEGAELTLAFDVGILSNNVSLEYLDAKDKDNNELARRAEHKAKWQGTIATRYVDWSLQYLYQGKRSDIGNTKLDAYSLFNMSAQFFATDELTVSARIENLLDEQYETAKGYPSAGRTMYLSGTYTF